VSILRRVNLGAGGYDLLLSGGLTTGLLYHESAISFLLPICAVMRASASETNTSDRPSPTRLLIRSGRDMVPLHKKTVRE
jgi:hypothetical protein